MRQLSLYSLVASLVLFAFISAPVTVDAQPEGLKYKKWTKRRPNIVLKDCQIIPGFNKVRILNKGRNVALPRSAKRSSYRSSTRYRFWACAPLSDEADVDTLFAKSSANGTPVPFELTEADFPETNDGPDDGGGQLSAKCSRVQQWPGSHIYKTVGSHHFTDIRRNTIGIILKPGARGPFPSCIDVLDKNGNNIADLGLYQTGNGWAARYYAGIGCGRSTPYNGSRIATLARNKSGSSSIYVDFGSTCYGPIDANRCIGSSQC